jgi:sugar/nucleoside kinase (ribokinase family)
VHVPPISVLMISIPFELVDGMECPSLSCVTLDHDGQRPFSIDDKKESSFYCRIIRSRGDQNIKKIIIVGGSWPSPVVNPFL